MGLEERILQRAQQYDKNCDETALKSHDTRMKSPVLFVLFGGRVQQGLKKIQEAMADRVLNAEGAVYLLIGGEKPKEEENVIYLPLPQDELDMQERRGRLGTLTEDKEFLQDMGTRLIEVRQRIMSKSRIFSFWEQINVCVVTMASDEENVLLQDVMVLIKNKLLQEFKQILVDLFVLLKETGEDALPFNKALAVSFFKELKLCEQPDFCYEKETEVLDDDMKLIVSYRGQLFDLVYVLTDKKENGQRIEEAPDCHYETIAAVSLLKNRENRTIEAEQAREQFNINVFTANIKEQAENRYCSAKLAKVKKPGTGIYLATAYHLFRAYKKTLSTGEAEDSRKLLPAAGLTAERIDNLISGCLPPEEGISQLHSLISTHASFSSLRGTSFKQAEEALYGISAEQFFKVNFEEKGEQALTSSLAKEKLREKLICELVNNPGLGPFAVKNLLQGSSLALVEAERERYRLLLAQLQAEIKEAYEKTIGERIGGNIFLLEKKYLHQVKDYLIQEIYERKYQCLMVQLKLKAIEKILEAIEQLYEELKEQLVKLEHIEELLGSMMENAQKYEEDYLVQNVNEYYKSVVEKKLQECEKNRGSTFFMEEKMMGETGSLLKKEESTILDRLFSMEEREILSDEKYFNTSFESELLARANMHIDYEDTQVAAKSELYALLYQSLEENSKPCVYLDTTLSAHRYIEKYFFGDRSSEFIAYAYKRDQSSRSYKIGTISDERKSVIEKLQLMGGFKLEDLVFTAPALRYYEAYRDKGCLFHTEEMCGKLLRQQAAENLEGGERNGK